MNVHSPKWLFGLCTPHSKTNGSRHWRTLFAILLFLTAFGSTAKAGKWPNSIENLEKIPFEVSWNNVDKSVDIVIGIAEKGVDYFAGFNIYVNGWKIWESPSLYDSGQESYGYTYWYNSQSSEGFGRVLVYNALASAAGYPLTNCWVRNYWAIAPFDFPVQDGNWAKIKLKLYPNRDFFDRSNTTEGSTITFSAKVNQGNDYLSISKKVQYYDPCSPITLSDLSYDEEGRLKFAVDRNSTDANFPRLEIENEASFSEQISLKDKAEDFYASTANSLGESHITGTRNYRLKYGWPDDTKVPTNYPEEAVMREYWKFSTPVQVLPIHLPKNLSTEYIGNGQVKITWEVNNTGQHSQAIDAMHVYVYDGDKWTTLSTNESTNKILYSQGSYIYTIPAAYDGTDNKTFKFEFNRYPFKKSHPQLAKSVEFTKNMNYLRPYGFDLRSSGSASFDLEWKNNDGFYRDEWKYRVRVEQEVEGETTLRKYTSMKIDANKTQASISLNGSNILNCSPAKVIMELVNNDNKMLDSVIVHTNFSFSDDVDSKIEKFSASKGFYSGRVQLDWKTSSKNDFAQYIIYRKEYGAKTEGDGMQVAVVQHSPGVTSYSYEDVNAVPGTFYQYKVDGQASCGTNTIRTRAFATNVGYIQPYGTISGRIAFEGGAQGVAGVSILAEGNSDAQNKAFDFAGDTAFVQIPYKEGLLSPTDFTFQAWLYRRNSASDKNNTIFQMPGKYALEIWPSSNNTVVFTVPKYRDEGGESSFEGYQAFLFNKYKFPTDTFVHLSVTFKVDITTKTVNNGITFNPGTAILYVDGAAVDTVTQNVASAMHFNTHVHPLYIGKWDGGGIFWNGYMDELRFWNRVLPADEIAQNHSRFISGKEQGLTLYYRFDELDGIGEVYDLSATGNTFNQNHGKIYGTVKRTIDPGTVPTPNQLAVKAVTDAEGNYLLNTVPYTGTGNSYTIRPVLGVHKFSPEKKPLFFSSNSTVHNSIDFTDVSSFIVSGTVVYEGGTFPVENCEFEVDDRRLVQTDGQPVRSQADGTFAINVPIGVHKVRVVKNGHSFVNDGLLLEPEKGTNRNYNDNLSNIEFKDKTRVKLIGHIVGGKREHEKTTGFGLTINNIGSDALSLTAQKDGTYAFIPTAQAKDTVFYHNTNDKWAKWTKKDENSNPPQPDSTKVNVSGKAITIRVSPRTGEYVAWVYPEIYYIEEIRAGSTVISAERKTLDLRDAPTSNDILLKTSIFTYTDSTWVNKVGSQAEHWEYFDVNDTVRYHAEWVYYYQAQPSYTIKQLKGKTPLNYFGIDQYAIDRNTKVDLVKNPESDTPEYIFGNPFFLSNELYAFQLSAFEEYRNDPIIDRVPVIGGRASFSGELLQGSGRQEVELDSLGTGIFEFYAGAPNLTDGIVSLSTRLSIDNYSFYSETFDDKGMNVFVLGGRSTGTDFMTAAGDKIDFILHDPPGSNSYAYIEDGSTVTTSESWDGIEGAAFEEKVQAVIGVEMNIITGSLFAGIAQQTLSTENKLGGEVNGSVKYKGNKTWQKTTAFKTRVQTSAATDFVGHPGDIFVGTGINTLYGFTNNIGIGRKNDFHVADTIRTAGEYAIGKQNAFNTGTSYGTQFVYTGDEIENIMIPKWEENRKKLFIFSLDGIDVNNIESPLYLSKLSVNDPNFAKLNDDKEAFGSAATDELDGPSYRVVLPEKLKNALTVSNQLLNTLGMDTTIAFTDSIWYYHNQVERWKAILADNEERKAKAGFDKASNISFGAGATIEKSETHSDVYSRQNGVEIKANVYFISDITFKAMKCGVEWENKVGVETENTYTDTRTTDNTSTVGFVLAETGTTDEISLDYRLDTLSVPPTYMFRTRGGRTSCPYEGEVRTKYFEPGQHILSEATMQIEVPKIALDGGAFRVQVPATRPAVFALKLTNESETNGTGYFKLTVDEKTNSDGAILKIDGLPVGNGRFFTVPSGQVLKKTLTVEKGPLVDKHEDIRLLFASDCDSELCDSVVLSAEFLPACSDVDVKYPFENWIVNTATGDSILIELENYDVNFNNLGYVELQYRRTSDAQWNSEMKFYANQERYNNANTPKRLLTANEPTIKYWWHKDVKGDGEYEFRAHTVCETTQGTRISEYYTPAVRGTVDMRRPESLGAPSPSNGVLTASNEISITFNENIQSGMLTQNNFSISGILNASILQEPVTGLAFDGTGTAFTELPEYLNGSFSIETWFKRTNGTAGTLFAYGEGSSALSLGFDAQGHAVVKVGSATLTSTTTLDVHDTWKYIGLAFHRSADPQKPDTVSVYRFQGSDPNYIMLDKRPISVRPAAQGKLYVGNNATGTDGLKGAVAHVHLYGKERTVGEMAGEKNVTKSGSEPYLMGLWEINEGEGRVAIDKARARNLTLTTGWYIYPVGRALSLAGNSYCTVPSGTFPFLDYDDFTLELKFRGASQSNVALLSLNPDTYIGFGADSKLTLIHKNASQTLSSDNLADNQWHHVALSVKRNGMTTASVDGAVTASFASSLLGEISSGIYTLGAHHTLNGVQDVFDRYFTGNIDELRVWSTALSTEAIKRNKNHKLRGDEKGLQAYYPFETWTKNPADGTYNVLASNANSAEANNTQTLTLGGQASISTIAAGMIDARPETKLGYGPGSDYTFTASDNKIVFNLLLPIQKIEGVTLTISADEILDMRNNLSQPVTWIAYVNRNPLNWTVNKVDIVTVQGETRTFTAGISNTGGTPEDYVIENLPVWLSVNAPSGTLQPLETKELTFTVSPSVNIGSYEVLATLTGANDVKKILPVHLKVNGQRPDWTVNPNDFESSMNITGQIKVEGTFQEDADDLLAAFIGDLCVGVTSPIYVSANNAYFTFFDVYGNAEHKDQALTFKFWDTSTGRIYPKVETSVADIRFVATKIVGSLANPVIFTTLDIAEQIIPLKKGWTWVSSNLLNDNPSVLSQMKSSLTDAGVIIKGRNAYVQQPNWKGTLSSISEKSMYTVNTNKEHALKLEGKYANPATTPLDINPEWNWISYLPSFILPVKDALAGINARTGDLIKGQTAYATYAGASGWIGSLSYMQEGKGYMYYSSNAIPQTLIYPSGASQVYQTPVLRSITAVIPNWSVDYSRFVSSMTLTAIVVNNNEEIRSAVIEIGAFSGSECRGSALLQYEADLDKYIGFLMIYGEDNDAIALKVYDHATTNLYTVNNAPLQFVADDMKGNPETPYIIALGSITGIESTNPTQIAIYPNPVSVNLYIDRPQQIVDVVEIIDLSGRVIFRKTDFSDESIPVSGLNKGVYLLKLVYSDQTIMRKFTKK